MDPDDFPTPRGRRRRDGRVVDASKNRHRQYKEEQLCRQVWRALTYALAGAVDDRLRGLTVASVVPAPDASRLLVALVPDTGRQPDDVPDLFDRLDCARSWLRREVAGAIVRKRAPELTFVIAPPMSAGEVRP